MVRLLALLACAAFTGCAAAANTVPAAPNGAIAAVAPAKPHHIAEFATQQTGSRNSVPFQVARGADGAMWFTEQGAGRIGRIDDAGHVKQFRIPTAGSQPQGIASGADGALYFAENAGPNPYDTHVSRITMDGRVTQWNDNNYMPEGVARGPNGTMWFTQGCAGLAVVSSGGVTQFNMPGVSGESTAIVEGPDRAMWFTEDGTRAIGRITSTGALTLYSGPLYKGRYDDQSRGVAVGPDGNLWWTSTLAGTIWAMDTRGRVVHAYKIPTPNAQPWGIVAARDGALWFTEWNGNKIGRVTVDGAFSEYALPTPGARPQGIAQGRDGALWFTEAGAGKIGRINL